jgi:branched-chain amino acid transport system ATP-binding protein
VEHGVGYVPQNANVFPSLTVEENLLLGGYREGGASEERLAAIYERFPALEERPGERAGNLSGGQQQMLAMGRALVLDPPLLLLDEPSAGLAPDLVTEMFDHIDRINKAGTAILIVEQNARTALRRCDRGYVLAQGENRHEGPGDELLEDEQVRRDFLGG